MRAERFPRVVTPGSAGRLHELRRDDWRSPGELRDEDQRVIRAVNVPGLRQSETVGGWLLQRTPANATTTMQRLIPAAPATSLPPQRLPNVDAANLTDVTAGLTSNSTFAQYLGVALAEHTSITLRYRVTTAAVTITWAEVGIATSPSFVINTAADLTTRGFTDVSGVWNSTGVKNTAITVSGIRPGDHLWGLWGNQASTIAVMRGALADDLATGFFQSRATTRPSTMAAASAFTVANSTFVPIWSSWQPSGGSPVIAAQASANWYADRPGRIVSMELVGDQACTAGTLYPRIRVTHADASTDDYGFTSCEINSTAPNTLNAAYAVPFEAAQQFEAGARLQASLIASSGFLPAAAVNYHYQFAVEYEPPA